MFKKQWCFKANISLSFETPLLDVSVQKGCVFLLSHSSTRLLNQVQNCAEAQPWPVLFLKLFTSTLDSQVFAASLSPWWISWAVEGSAGRPQLHAELSCSCCRGAATGEYLGYHCLHVRCSYTQFWCNSSITLLWTGVAIQEKKMCVGFKVKISCPA